MGHYGDVMDVHTATGAHDISLSDIDAQDLVRSLSTVHSGSVTKVDVTRCGN